MCQRKKTEEKGINLRMRVESKREMKARNLPSPDLVDAMFILLEVCRVRLGFDSGSVVRSKNKDPNKPVSTFKNLFQKLASVYEQTV